MVARVHRLQFVHSATSMTMFHFFMACTFSDFSSARRDLRSFPRTRDPAFAESHRLWIGQSPGPRVRGDERGEAPCHFAGTSVGAAGLRLALGSGLAVAKAAETCSARPSQGSISTRELAPAKIG